MIKIKECNQFLFPSECPPGTFAGTVVIYDAIHPSPIFLYSESGLKFDRHDRFYESLYERGFRYFQYIMKGQMQEMIEV